MKDALVDIFAAAYVKAILAGVATLVYNAIARVQSSHLQFLHLLRPLLVCATALQGYQS